MELIESSNAGISVGDTFIFILLYVDDIVLVADNENDLQQLVEKLETFCEQSQMTVNVPKTKWMIFEKKVIDQTSDMNIFFNGEALEKVDSFQYLGIFFSTNLNFSEHANYTLIKAEKASHLFRKYVS